MKKVYLLTGQPGTGKTTIIKDALASSGVRAGGFYTEEIRRDGVRQGFKIVTLDGREAMLSGVSISSQYRVGKYGVDLKSLEEVGVSALLRAIEKCELVVIDEIGKMELFSSKFKEAVIKAVESGKKVLGTIMLSPNPFTDAIKRRPEIEIVTVTRANREKVLGRVLGWLKEEGVE